MLKATIAAAAMALLLVGGITAATVITEYHTYSQTYTDLVTIQSKGQKRVVTLSGTVSGTITDQDTIPDPITVTVTGTEEPPTTTTTEPPPPSDEPAPIAGQGYSKVWSDEFVSFNGGDWGEGIWYDTNQPAGSVYTSLGVLHLVSKRADGYPDIAVTTEGGDNPVIFTQGYFEARMRWTKGAGAWPAFWLLSYRHAVNPDWPSINSYCADNGLPVALCYSAELDVFEGQGREPNVFYGTIHRNSCNCYGVSNSQNGNNWHPMGIDLTAAFHDYGMLWTATEIRWYLDGQFIHSAPVYDSTNQPMFLLFQMWIGGWTGGTDSTTPNELHTEVDWVRVWQK